jgi:hypothetical protein
MSDFSCDSMCSGSSWSDSSWSDSSWSDSSWSDSSWSNSSWSDSSWSDSSWSDSSWSDSSWSDSSWSDSSWSDSSWSDSSWSDSSWSDSSWSDSSWSDSSWSDYSWSDYSWSNSSWSESNYSDSSSLSDLFTIPEDEPNDPFRDEMSVPSLTDRINSDSYTSPPSENMNSPFSDPFSDTSSNPANGDISLGTLWDAYSAAQLPGYDWPDNFSNHLTDWVEENISYDLVNDPWQWAQDHPLEAAGIGAAGIGGAAAYYNNFGNLSGSFGFDVGNWQFDFDLGVNQNKDNGSDDFHFQLDVTYPF